VLIFLAEACFFAFSAVSGASSKLPLSQSGTAVSELVGTVVSDFLSVFCGCCSEATSVFLFVACCYVLGAS